MKHNIVAIKGTATGLAIHINTQFDFSEIEAALKSHIIDSNGFFEDAKFKLHPSSDDILTPEQCNRLEQICSDYGLTPMSAIMEIEDTVIKNEPSEEKHENFLGISETEMQQENHFISKSIRNGEKLALKGNIILLGDINPGSEVMATGNIIVMGSVKGTVHAGIEGNLDSFIIASILDPLQIRIGNLIACKLEKSESIKNHTPEIAQVKNNRVVISPYLTNALSR